MTLLEDQRPRLERIAQSAQAIGTHLSGILAAQPRPIHFRPAANGITLVGLTLDCPQRGHSRYSAERLRTQYLEEFEQHCTKVPGRNTPEKRLQSFLIRDAYQHDRQMAALRSVAGDDPTADLRFITDELALYASNGEKLVCDLLAFRRSAADSSAIIPVLIELKSARDMTCLVAQLTRFAREIGRYREEIAKIAGGLLGEKVSFTYEPELWLVWKAAGSRLDTDPREAELSAQGIRVVQYVLNGDGIDDGYCFHVGPRPAEINP